MSFAETKTRTFWKTIAWRIIAVFNSYFILAYFQLTEPIFSAIMMNITGFVLYFMFERFVNRINYGKVKVNE